MSLAKMAFDKLLYEVKPLNFWEKNKKAESSDCWFLIFEMVEVTPSCFEANKNCHLLTPDWRRVGLRRLQRVVGGNLAFVLFATARVPTYVQGVAEWPSCLRCASRALLIWPPPVVNLKSALQLDTT